MILLWETFNSNNCLHPCCHSCVPCACVAFRSRLRTCAHVAVCSLALPLHPCQRSLFPAPAPLSSFALPRRCRRSLSCAAPAPVSLLCAPCACVTVCSLVCPLHPCQRSLFPVCSLVRPYPYHSSAPCACVAVCSRSRPCTRVAVCSLVCPLHPCHLYSPCASVAICSLVRSMRPCHRLSVSLPCTRVNVRFFLFALLCIPTRITLPPLAPVSPFALVSIPAPTSVVRK